MTVVRPGRTRRALAALWVGAAMGCAAPPLATQHHPPVDRILADVRSLASDELGGRLTGSPGNDSAAAFIARRLRALGLRPGGDGGTWFQEWVAGTTTATLASRTAGVSSRNVIGVLPGAGALARQAVLVGAHFDHLGTGPFGSLAPDSAGRIHNGADDNASGTAAVFEVARLLIEERRRERPGSARTIVFVLFSGEEQGLLGSAHYAEHPLVPIESTLAMINLDMVGRLRDRRLLALGALTAREWPALVDSANALHGLEVRASSDGWGRSDHSSFFAKGRPVLHLFTDLHEDYHRPSDDWDRINAEGIGRVAAFTADLVRRLASRPAALTFVDAPRPAATAQGDRAYLGTIPDMTDEPGGVRLAGVRVGSPAAAAELRAGDVLIGLGDHVITGLQDLQNALVAHRPGERVEIRFRRGDQTLAVTVVLGRRS